MQFAVTWNAQSVTMAFNVIDNVHYHLNTGTQTVYGQDGLQIAIANGARNT